MHSFIMKSGTVAEMYEHVLACCAMRPEHVSITKAESSSLIIVTDDLRLLRAIKNNYNHPTIDKLFVRFCFLLQNEDAIKRFGKLDDEKRLVSYRWVEMCYAIECRDILAELKRRYDVR
jgi:hypothetical protein